MDREHAELSLVWHGDDASNGVEDDEDREREEEDHEADRKGNAALQ